MKEENNKKNEMIMIIVMLIIFLLFLGAFGLKQYGYFPEKKEPELPPIIYNDKELTWNLVKDTKDSCTGENAKIYEDSEYEYKLYNSGGCYHKIAYSNGEEYTIKEAIEKKKITIEDLKAEGLMIYKVKKSYWTIDKGNEDVVCTQVLEKIYEDSEYEYKVSNSCIANYKIVYSNGESYTIKEALEKKIVTIEELQSKDIKIIKKSKNQDWRIDKGNENVVCTQALEKIYEDSEYEYIVTDSCIANYKIVYSNGESYTLKEALEKKKVTVEDLINNGISIRQDLKN